MNRCIQKNRDHIAVRDKKIGQSLSCHDFPVPMRHYLYQDFYGSVPALSTQAHAANLPLLKVMTLSVIPGQKNIPKSGFHLDICKENILL